MGVPIDTGSNKYGSQLEMLAKTFYAGQFLGGSTVLKFNVLETEIAAASTSDITFTDKMPNTGNALCQIWGGYIEVTGMSNGATLDLDFGHTAHLTIFQEAIDDNGFYGLDAASYEAATEDVVITITSNNSTTPITCKVVLLTCVPVTS
jgi:hypothetical protein